MVVRIMQSGDSAEDCGQLQITKAPGAGNLRPPALCGGGPQSRVNISSHGTGGAARWRSLLLTMPMEATKTRGSSVSFVFWICMHESEEESQT